MGGPMIDWRIVALIVALALLGWGLYKLFGAVAPPPPKPAPKPVKPSPKLTARISSPPRLAESDDDEEQDDITIVTRRPSRELKEALEAERAKTGPRSTPRPEVAKPLPPVKAPPVKPVVAAREESVPDEDDGDDDYLPEGPAAIPLPCDDEAAIDEPTRLSPIILVTAASQTDRGRKRKRNEDCMLSLEDHHLYVVADGMGGHAGGEIASRLCTDVIGATFTGADFAGDSYPDVPRRGSELAVAIQKANRAIYDRAKVDTAYQGMGTTVVAARFSPNKQRLYVGHVGDSRCYRLRGQALAQLTTDHTMGAEGVTGPLASHLNRAVGVAPSVKIDVIIDRPLPEDVYLLCSDGLSKMLDDDRIRDVLLAETRVEKAVETLVEQANARGGRDNITVILVQVKDPKGFAGYVRSAAAG